MQMQNNASSYNSLYPIIWKHVHFIDGENVFTKKTGGLFLFLFIYLFVHSFIHLFVYSFIYSFIHLYIFIYLFIRSFVHSFIRLFVYLFIHSFIHLFILFITSLGADVVAKGKHRILLVHCGYNVRLLLSRFSSWVDFVNPQPDWCRTAFTSSSSWQLIVCLFPLRLFTSSAWLFTRKRDTGRRGHSTHSTSSGWRLQKEVSL